MGFFRSSQVLALVLITACGGRSRDSGANPETTAMLQVENRGFTDMTVYALSGGQRVRLGMATGNSTKSFPIPSYLLRGAGPLRFLADPIGSNRTPVSEEMTVRPGDIVTLTIPP
jgi:hypothetical protein